MNPDEIAGGSSNTETITITVNGNNGTLTISKGSCNVSPDEDNPSPGWNKTTYINPSGTITITVQGKKVADAVDEIKENDDEEEAKQDDPTKGLKAAISGEKEGVAELYHYTNVSSHVLKLKKGTNYYIYYYNTSTSKWTKYNDTNNGTGAATDVKTVIETHLSNIPVEIQLEITTNQNYGLVDVDDKRINVGNATFTVPNYTGYKHSKNGGFNLQKVRHSETEIGGFTLPIASVEEVHVYYKNDSSNQPIMDNPLLLYTKTSGTTKYTIYGKGKKNFQMHWWNIKELKAAPTDTVLQRHLEMLLNRNIILKEFPSSMIIIHLLLY